MRVIFWKTDCRKFEKNLKNRYRFGVQMKSIKDLRSTVPPSDPPPPTQQVTRPDKLQSKRKKLSIWTQCKEQVLGQLHTWQSL
ncbi:hypothetical protein Ahy_A07g036413 isoform C [Arachis hypogaea]|uniref:Uncharacterized protein n=1 Tax=Arachis hypogaea TaxID=3818 RepID=A0A445CG31_ARAHY|nr:hypothetical protein Ahy_A07g036413 isoform C [Arachis hypogaea]